MATTATAPFPSAHDARSSATTLPQAQPASLARRSCRARCVTAERNESVVTNLQGTWLQLSSWKEGARPSAVHNVANRGGGLQRQRRDFGRFERPDPPFGEFPERTRPDRAAQEPQHADAVGSKQPPDLPVAAFVEHDREP